MDDLEEIVLFPELERAVPPAEPELPPAIVAQREWLVLQIQQIESLLRKHKLPPKPAGLDAAAQTYLDERLKREALQASKIAYAKALNKQDHFNRSAE